MGKSTGFLEYTRVETTAIEPLERIRNFNEFHLPLSDGLDLRIDLRNRAERSHALKILRVAELEIRDAVTVDQPPIFVAAAALVSAYMDLGVDGKANLFLPYADGYKVLAAGAVLAKNVVPIEVFFGTSESETAVENVTCFEIDRADVKLIIRDFSDFDDYVLDPISALAAGAYDAVDADETPSIIVSVASPMRFATEVLSALGVRAKDEKVAREKLEELFAVEPIEE